MARRHPRRHPPRGRAARSASALASAAVKAQRIAVAVGAVTRAQQPDLDRVRQPRLVEHQRERARPDRRQRAEHHRLGHARHPVPLGEDRGAEQDVDRLLERRLRERAGLGPVDAVAGDGHKVAARGHRVDEHGQVAVVDVGACDGGWLVVVEVVVVVVRNLRGRK